MSGTLKGKVELHRDNGALIDDASGVSVNVVGTSFSTQTATDGTWQFDSLPAGTYVILLKKDGFGEYKYPNQRFVGGGIDYVPLAQMYGPPSFAITSFTIRMDSRVQDSNVRLFFQGTMDKKAPVKIVPYNNSRVEAVGVNIYIGPDPSVSDQAGHYTYQLYAQTDTSSADFAAFLPLPSAADFLMLTNGGNTLYAVAYPGVYRTYYNDPITDDAVFTDAQRQGSQVVSVNLW